MDLCAFLRFMQLLALSDERLRFINGHFDKTRTDSDLEVDLQVNADKIRCLPGSKFEEVHSVTKDTLASIRIGCSVRLSSFCPSLSRARLGSYRELLAQLRLLGSFQAAEAVFSFSAISLQQITFLMWILLLANERMDEEAIEVDHLLVEPQFFRTLDDNDDAICFGSKKVEKSLTIGGILCTTAYDDDESGILDAHYELIEEQASKYEFIDSILQGAAEDENLHAASSFLCDCSGYILGSDVAENSLLDGSRNGGTGVKNVVSAGRIQIKDDDDVKSAWLCDVKSPVVYKADQPDLSFGPMDDCEINETFHIAADRHAFIEDSKGLNSQLVFDQPDLTWFNNSNLMENKLLSSENDDHLILIPGNELSKGDHGSLIESSCTRAKDGCVNRFGEATFIELNHQTCKFSRKTNDAVRNTKRLHKPTKRYIEETPELKSRYTYTRVKQPLFNYKGHVIHASEEKKHQKGAQLLYQDSDKMHSPEFIETKAKEFKNAPIPQYIMRRVRELSVIHPYPRNQKSIKYGFVRCSS
ncbi:hypothetical protein HPP92_025950 [Vanilla planifolia]|uniref:Uncharacterized protein n=1 Tax=Vanilla planifolia TaxID=51239 RepID=A0A835PF49_VANPL|nr:hypothetical protein HPP92_025950 [Vanilla planifolia]